MADYLIFMDVAGDIDPVFAAENDLHFVSMEYSLGSSMRTCLGMEPESVLREFYNGQRNGDFTKTTQITPYSYQETFAPYMEQGLSILYLCLSSGLSSTYESACLAKQILEAEYPQAKLVAVDTLSATAGMGVLTERAIRNRAAGLSLSDNEADLLEARTRIQALFMVQDLMYLKRGGRVSAASAVIGTALNIRPILYIDEKGKLTVSAKKRGNKMAVSEIIARSLNFQAPHSADPIYVLHSDAPDLAAQLAKAMEEAFPDVAVKTIGLSPIIGAHTGPGMAAIVSVR